MDVYISKQAAIDRINEQRKGLKPDKYQQDRIGDFAYRVCAEIIGRLHPADVRPVVPGTWDRRDKKHFNDFYCSNCQMLHHHVPTIMAVPQWSFCPNCGADMKEAQP